MPLLTVADHNDGDQDSKYNETSEDIDGPHGYFDYGAVCITTAVSVADVFSAAVIGAVVIDLALFTWAERTQQALLAHPIENLKAG